MRLGLEELTQEVECSYSWTSRLLPSEGDEAGSRILETQVVFVMADRREDGFDSRCFGPVPIKALAGIA